MKIKSTFFIIIFFFTIAFLVIHLYAGVADDYYQRILNAKFYSDKIALGEQLGRLRTPEAKSALLKLMKAESYWDREAAVVGLFALQDTSVADVLWDNIKDHMIDNKIKEGFKNNSKLFYSFFIRKYKSAALNQEERNLIVDIIGGSKTPEGEKFLKDIIENKLIGDRGYALLTLGANYSATSYNYIKGFISDPQLKEYVLSFLAKNGTAQDLQIFLDILNGNNPNTYKVISFEAVNKWGTLEQKKTTMLNALKSNDEVMIRGALLVFKGIKSDQIFDELCRISKQSENQDTRFMCADELGTYKSKKAVPYLIIMLDDDYIPPGKSIIESVLNPLTIGIFTIFGDIARRQDRKAFEAYQRRFAEHLTSITGQNFGTSYQKWLDWAVLSGYTVNGINIAQYLFSGYPDVRKKAIDSSLLLLGYRNMQDFVAKNPSAQGKSDLQLSTIIVPMLIEKGIIVNEPY